MTNTSYRQEQLEIWRLEGSFCHYNFIDHDKGYLQNENKKFKAKPFYEQAGTCISCEETRDLLWYKTSLEETEYYLIVQY